MKTDVEGIIAKFTPTRGGGLIAILEEIQSKYGYLSEDALRTVAQKTGKSLTDIYGVATFYKGFSLKPRGKHHVTVCLGTACHVRGAPRIAEAFERNLGVKAGDCTNDREFSLETVNCVGACALSPIVVVDGHYFSKVKTTSVKPILKKSAAGLDHSGVSHVFPVEISCSKCNHSLMDTEHLIDELPSVRVTISFGKDHGWLRLSSLYGSYDIESEYPIPMTEVANFFCPHCHTELLGGARCNECGIGMVPLIVSGGGIVQICPRRGCKGHILDLVGTEATA